MLWQRILLNPLPIVTKQIPVLGVSATGRMLKRLLIVLSLLVLPHLVVAQETSSWIGQKVVTKYEYPITSWYLVVPTHGFHVYTVQRTSGDWLWVVSGSVKGWIPVSQVVRFDQAIDFYTQEIAANPGNSAAWNLRGLIWNEKKEYDKAIADFNEVIRLDPKDALAYNNRGNAWCEKKDTTRRSPTSTKPSGSIPSLPSPTTTVATPGGKEGLRQGNRRLQRGHPARSQVCPAYNNRGSCLE